MNNFVKYLLINLSIAGIIGFLFTEPRNYYRSAYGGTHADLGLAFLLLSLPMLIVGLIITIVANDKSYGTSMLTASGLLILIGFGVCTIN